MSNTTSCYTVTCKYAQFAKINSEKHRLQFYIIKVILIAIFLKIIKFYIPYFLVLYLFKYLIVCNIFVFIAGGMRICPMALFTVRESEEIAANTTRECTLITHTNYLGYNGAILQVIGIKFCHKDN